MTASQRWAAITAAFGLLVAGCVATQLTLPAGPAAADAATGSAGLFMPAAGRLLDTRNGTGGYATPMPANTVRTVPTAGVAGIPASGVSAVALTLTVVGATTAGAVSVAPGDVASPSGTALVFNPGDSVSNTDLVALHADGQLHVVSNASANLIIDVQGYFTAGSATAPGGFVPVDQTRIVDTRIGTNVPQARVATGGSITVTATGLAGVPVDASAVYANIAILGQTTNGYLRTFAAGSAVPTTGALGFDDTTQTESVAIPLSSSGAFTVLVGAGGPVDLLIDIQGYFTPSAGDRTFTPAAVHLLDTRAAPVRPLAGNSVMTLSVGGVLGIPAVSDGLAAVALNLRTVETSTPGSGFLRVWPSDAIEPTTSSVNYTNLNTYRTDLAIVAPAADGTVSIRNGGAGPIDLVVNVEGWFSYIPGPKPDSALAAAGDHGPVAVGGDDPPPAGGQNETVSGTFTNAAGQPLANMPVQITVPQTAAVDGSESAPTLLGTVTTDASGAWSFTPPASLPSDVQAVVNANSGVLNLEAETAGTAPDGTVLDGMQSVSVGVPTSQTNALTTNALEVNASRTPAPSAVHVMAVNATEASAPTEAQAAQSDSSTAAAEGSPDYQPSAWESDTAPTDTPYNPDLVNGTDYSSTAVTPADWLSGCYTTTLAANSTIAYTTVGEEHAYWDTKGSFTWTRAMSNSIGIKVSADGTHWNADGTWTLENHSSLSVSLSPRGPFYAHQFQIPVRYEWSKRRHSCYYWLGRHFSYTTYEIYPYGYSIPAGGLASRIGPDVSDNDGYVKFAASNRTYRAQVEPGTALALHAGRSITYGLGASVFGVGISAQTIYDSYHEQAIQAGYGNNTHDIWGAKGPIDGHPGVFYSW